MMAMMMTRLPAEYPAGGDASVRAQSHLARGGARLVREEDDHSDDDGDNDDGDDDGSDDVGDNDGDHDFYLLKQKW